MSVRTGIMIVSLVLSIAIGLVLSRGGAHEPSTGEGDRGQRERPRSEQLLIGLSMDTLKEARWQADRDAIVRKAKELGAEVLVQSANGDDTRQIADVEALISRNVDVLVIIPHDSVAAAKAVDLAHAASIPVIAYDRIVKDADLDLYLSFDNTKVGEAQAKFVVERLPKGKKARIARIYGSRGDMNSHLFKQGQDAVLLPHIERGDVVVVHEDWADDWKPENAKKIVNAAITQHGKDIDAVLASNDGTAGGAVQALLEEGLAGKVIVTGQDAELVACQRIVGGTQSMTVYKPLKVLAEKTAEMAVALARRRVVVANSSVNNGKVDVPAVLSGIYTVTKENLRDTVIKDGFLRESDVFGGTR